MKEEEATEEAKMEMKTECRMEEEDEKDSMLMKMMRMKAMEGTKIVHSELQKELMSCCQALVS